MLDPKSDILTALYHGDGVEAERLAGDSHSLTIWEAAALGRDRAIDRHLDDDASLVNAPAPDGHLPIGLAAFFARPSTVRLLLARGADVHLPARNPMKVQALHAAVASRSVETVEAVLSGRPDVNARQQVGYTPLMGAAAAGSEVILDLLLQRGADASAVSDDGKTAADVAREHGHAAVAERLSSART